MTEKKEKGDLSRTLKHGVVGAILGGFAVIAVGFTQLGWMGSGSAKELADTAVTNTLAEICAQNASLDLEQLDAFRDTSTWEKDDFVEDAGWATFPGSENPNSAVADACVRLLNQNAA